MKRSFKKFLSFSLAVMTVVGGLNISPASAYAEETAKTNGDFELIGDYEWDSYMDMGNISVLASNASEGYTADTEFCIMNSCGDSISVSNKNADGSEKYSYISPGVVEYCVREDGSIVMLTESLKLIGEGGKYYDITAFELNDNTYYFAAKNTDATESSGYIWDVIDENNKVIKENVVSTGRCGISVDNLGNYLIIRPYAGEVEIVLDTSFKLVNEDLTSDCIHISVGDNCIVACSDDGKIYTWDQSLKMSEITIEGFSSDKTIYVSYVIINNKDYPYVYQYNEEGEYIEYYFADAKTAVKFDSYSSSDMPYETVDEGLKINGKLITHEQFQEYIFKNDKFFEGKDATVQYIDAGGSMYSYVYYVITGSYVETDIELGEGEEAPTYDFCRQIVLAEVNDYALDKGLICDGYANVTPVAYELPIVDGSDGIYLASKDGWNEVMQWSWYAYAIQDGKGENITFYDFENNVLCTLKVSDIVKKSGIEGDLNSLTINQKSLYVTVSNGTDMVFMYVPANENNEFSINDAVIEKEDFIYSTYDPYFFHYTDTDGKKYIYIDGKWNELIYGSDYAYSYVYKNSEGKYKLYSVYDEYTYSLDTAVDKVYQNGDKFIFGKKQEDGTWLYALAKEIDKTPDLPSNILVSDSEISKLDEKLELGGEAVPEDAYIEISSVAQTKDEVNTIRELVGKIYEAVKEKVTNYIAIDITMFKDDEKVQPLNNGKVSITIPVFDDYKDAECIDVFRVDDEKGELVFVGRSKVESGKIKFETDHFSTYIFVEAASDMSLPVGETPAPAPTPTPEPETPAPAPTPAPEPETSTPAPQETPNTGDSSNVTVMLWLLCLASGVMLILKAKKKENN